MGYRVISYEVAEQLMFSDSAFNPYKNAIHITATNSLKRGMMESNTELTNWFDGPIISFSELSKYIGDKWFLGETELQQFTSLSKALREFIGSHPNVLPDLFSSIDKNQDTLLKTMRLLTESGIESKEARIASSKKISPEEEIFFKLWSVMEKMGCFKAFNKWFKTFENNTLSTFSNVLYTTLENLVKSDEKRIKANILPHTNIKTLVENQFSKRKVLILHGFYFILPIQKRIFEQLSKHVELIHVVNYKKGFRNGFQAVETFLNLSNTEVIEASDRQLPVNSNAKRFLEAINGVFADENELENFSTPNYYEFANLNQFKNYVQSSDDVVVSPRAIEVKGYLEDIYTAKNHKLTQYPMGQFLLDIHRLNTRIYTVKDKKYVDKENVSLSLILRLFNSGYLIIDGEVANKYVEDIKKIAPLLENATTFEDWRNQIHQLIDYKHTIEQTLNHKLALKDVDHMMYTFYNRSIGFFNVRIRNLRSIITGINNIENLYKRLYVGENIPVRDYVEILENHLNDKIFPSLQKEIDSKVADKILDSLAELKGASIESLDRQDLMRGLNLFLSRDLDTDEYQGELYTEDSIGSSDIISTLLNSDGLPFAENRFIHFSLMDNKAFPNTQQLMTWPLAKETLDVLCNKNINLRQLKLRKDLEIDIACYLLYVIMSNAIKVKFSIVKELNQEEKLNPSFYLQLLNLKKASMIEIMDARNETPPLPKVKRRISSLERNYEILIRKTYNRCPKRTAFSFLMNKRPDFNSPFHETFVFRNMLRYVKNSSMDAIEWKRKYKEIYDYFPHWTDTKKDMNRWHIENYMSKNKGRPNYTRLDGHYYRNAQVNLTLFGEKSPNEVSKNEQDFDQPNKAFAKPGSNCKYCPYQEICSEAQLWDKN